VRGNLCLLHTSPDDRQKSFLQVNGAIDFPCAVLGGYCIRRNDEDDSETDAAIRSNRTAESAVTVSRNERILNSYVE
jgi:hypothetical protein